MHIQTHILSGWCIANCLPCTPRQRVVAMIAAAAPDVDGISILFGQNAYWNYHHTFGHNLFFAIFCGVACSFWARRNWLGTFFLCVAMVHLHLLMDYWGSGRDWHIHYLWPMAAPIFRNPDAWELYSWQNMVAFAVLLIWTVAIAKFYRRTPLEILMPRLDRELVDRSWLSRRHVR